MRKVIHLLFIRIICILFTSCENKKKNLNGTRKGKYSIESVTINQKTIIKVKYNLSRNQGSFYVKKNMDVGNVTYKFKVGNSLYFSNSISKLN